MSTKTWIQSYSGKMVEPGNLTVEMVSRADIGHALAQKVRFSGHLIEPYSVAQHCVMGSSRVDPKFKLAFLLHEVSEVYLPDIPTPIKRMTFFNSTGSEPWLAWTELEDQHARVIFSALGVSDLLPLLDSPEIHEADLRMLMTEKAQLLGPSPAPWGIDAQPYEDMRIKPWTWDRAEYLFNRALAEELVKLGGQAL